MRNRSLLLASIIALISVPITSAADDEGINLRRTTTVGVVERTKDAVVYIHSEKLVRQRVAVAGDDLMSQFFPQIATRDVPVGSLGSGFLIHPDGYIVTNNHVIDRARQISVDLSDGQHYNADLVSADVKADLALLRIHADKPLPTLTLGDSSDLMIGEPVIAVGNPLGYSHTVSTGIVSALHRKLDMNNNDEVDLSDLIQTDAAINPGNSGGPLLNAYGQVIGINNAVRTDAQNIGFAIPIDRLRDLIPELMDPTAAIKYDVPIKFKEHRSVSPPATVTAAVEVERQGKTLTVAAIDGKQPANIVDAYAIVLHQKGKPFTVQFTDSTSTTIEPKAVPIADALLKARTRMGLELEPLSPMLAEKYGLNTEDGMLVKKVLHNTPAEKAGIQPNDVLQQIGMYRVSVLQDLGILMDKIPAGAPVSVGIVRGQQSGTLTMHVQ